MKTFTLFVSCLLLLSALLHAQPPKSRNKPRHKNVEFVLPPPVKTDSVESSPSLSIGIGEAETVSMPVMGERIDPQERLARLNQPYLLADYSQPVQQNVMAIEKQFVKTLGEKYYKQYVRISKDEVDRMEQIYKLRGEGFDGDGDMPYYAYVTLLYGELLDENLSVPVADGKITPKRVAALEVELAAYRKLFEGKLAVSPEEAFKIAFGDRKPYDYSLHLRGGKKGDLLVPGNAGYKRPDVYWYIWENACTTCQEAEIDANNPQNFYKVMLGRKW